MLFNPTTNMHYLICQLGQSTTGGSGQTRFIFVFPSLVTTSAVASTSEEITDITLNTSSASGQDGHAN